MHQTRLRASSPVVPWIYLAALLSTAGWVLSAAHALNKAGYLMVFAIGLVAAWVWREELGWAAPWRCNLVRLRRRFRRFFPAAFLVIALLAMVGGILHAPNNYDALAYRLPRVLHWLAAEQWHWIHTDFQRLNTRAPGYEWLAAPLMLFTHSPRLLFLIGMGSLLLLPGLVFSVFTRLGVAPRAAWHWMWLAPTGYSFVLQAGGVGNDILGGLYALAAVDLCLRARRSQKFFDAATACLAIGLLTGAKTSNLPLVLPCVIALWPCWRLLLRRPFGTAAVAAVTLLVSFLPMAILNHRQCGDWSGSKAEAITLSTGDPKILLPGNLLILTAQNFAPPIFPLASRWNDYAPRLMPAKFHQAMRKNFEPSGANLSLTEMQNEEFSGLGVGLSALWVMSVLAGWRARRAANATVAAAPTEAGLRLVRWSPYISALAYGVKANIGTAARIFTPYYLLLMPLWLAQPEQSHICRKRWWRVASGGVFALAAVLLVTTPSRPLFPAQTILQSLVKSQPGNLLWPRALTVYSVYAIRSAGLSPVREKLPATARVVGLVTIDELEATLWPPYGQRRFEHVRATDTRDDLLRRGIDYVVVSGWVVDRSPASTIVQWMTRFGGTLEATVPLRLRASSDPVNWYIVRLHGGEPKS